MRWIRRRSTYWDWKPWFAWYPILIGDTWVWWETIARKREVFWDSTYYKYDEVSRIQSNT